MLQLDDLNDLHDHAYLNDHAGHADSPTAESCCILLLNIDAIITQVFQDI